MNQDRNEGDGCGAPCEREMMQDSKICGIIRMLNTLTVTDIGQLGPILIPKLEANFGPKQKTKFGFNTTPHPPTTTTNF